jgi:hypothetical protein
MRSSFTTRLILSLAAGVVATTMAGASFADGPRTAKPSKLIRYIDNYGTYAVVHYNKAVNNTVDDNPGVMCTGAGQYLLDNPDKIQSFHIDYTTADGKALFVHLLAAAAARKKTQIHASTCDSTNGTGLPNVDSVDTRF